MDEATRYFQSRFLFDPRRDTVWKEVCRFLQQKYIAEQSAILEIGAGHCHFINQIRGREKHALDVSDEITRYAGEGVRTHLQSCTNMSEIEDAFFDLVFASNVLEHLSREDTANALSEIGRVLKQNGRLILLQPNFRYCFKDYFDDYTHVQIFTDRSLADLLIASGFSIIDSKPRFLPFSMKSNLPKHPWLVRLYLQSPVKPLAGQMLIVAQPERISRYVG